MLFRDQSTNIHSITRHYIMTGLHNGTTNIGYIFFKTSIYWLSSVTGCARAAAAKNEL